MSVCISRIVLVLTLEIIQQNVEWFPESWSPRRFVGPKWWNVSCVMVRRDCMVNFRILYIPGAIFWNIGPVLTYPDIFASATFSFRIRLPSRRIRRIRQRIQKKINPLSREEKNKSATNPITCGRVNPDIFQSDDVKSVSSLLPNHKPIWRHNVSGEQSKFPATISLYGACSEDILVQRSLGY